MGVVTQVGRDVASSPSRQLPLVGGWPSRKAGLIRGPDCLLGGLATEMCGTPGLWSGFEARDAHHHRVGANRLQLS
jgi:hypothetical protein